MLASPVAARIGPPPEGESANALVPLHRLLHGGRVSGERDSTLRERRHWARVPEPVRDSAWRRAIASVGQRLVGLGESRRRVPTPGAGRELRVPSLASCPGRGRGWSGGGADALAHLWTLLRRSVRRARPQSWAHPRGEYVCSSAASSSGERP